MGGDSINHEDGLDPQNGARSTLISRNVTVLGHRTSVRLEPEMWTALADISRREDCRIHDLCSLIQLRKKPDTSLTAAIRVFLMLYYRASSTEEGHRRCGHGNFANMLSRARVTIDIVRAKQQSGKDGKFVPSQNCHPGASRDRVNVKTPDPGLRRDDKGEGEWLPTTRVPSPGIFRGGIV